MGRKRELNIILDRPAIRKILAVGHELDVNKNGMYDARSGCVNIWCSPEDKPSCWPVVSQGGLDYPRDYVSGIYWDWDNDDKAKLYIEVDPFELVRQKEKEDRWKPANDWITEEEWDELFRWSIEKLEYLLNVSGLRFSNA